MLMLLQKPVLIIQAVASNAQLECTRDRKLSEANHPVRASQLEWFLMDIWSQMTRPSPVLLYCLHEVFRGPGRRHKNHIYDSRLHGM